MITKQNLQKPKRASILRSSIKGLALLLITLVTLTQCSKEKQAENFESMAPISPSGKPVGGYKSVLNPSSDWLKFKDVDEFRHSIELIMNQDESVLDAWEAKKNHFSLRKFFLTAPNDGEENYVEDVYFSTILNKDGVYQIADDIYMIKGGTVYTIPAGGEYIIPVLSRLLPDRIQAAGDYAINAAGVIVQELDRTYNQTPVPGGGVFGGPTEPLRGTQFFSRKYDFQLLYKETSNNDDRKLVGECWNVSFPGYHSFGCRTKNEYKKGGKWKPKDAHYLDVYWKYKWKRAALTDFNTDQVFFSKSNTGKNEVDKTVEWEAGSSDYYQIAESFTDHNVKQTTDNNTTTWTVTSNKKNY